MFKKLEELVENYYQIEQEMAKPEVTSDPAKIAELNKAYLSMQEIVNKYSEYKKITSDVENLKQDMYTEKDEEMKEMIHDEVKMLEEKIPILEEELKVLLLPTDPNDSKNVIIEIRGGAGGDEAALFAADLFRMYVRYAERRGWKSEVIDKNEIGVGGLKEIVFIIKGEGAYSRLKFESGVHRVQRVPETEASGRIHTSTTTVAVLPEIDDVQQIEINQGDLKIDTYRAGGAGGQHVNMTDSAVRITHLPTGIVVSCQDERSQLKNKASAMKVLASKLYEAELEKQRAEVDSDRKLQVGTGARSEKIRTYNFPQGRVTDHRIGLTLYKLVYIMDGDLEEILDSLITFDQTERLTQEIK